MLNVPKKLTRQQGVTLCKKADLFDPVICYKNIRGITDIDTKIELCSENSAEPPVNCIKAAPFDFSDREKVYIYMYNL